jgi:hypothetical protein
LIGRPPEQVEPARRPRATVAPPVFRIHTEGTFGSTEVRIFCFHIAVRPSLFHLRWIIRMIVRYSRQYTAQNRFLSGLDTSLATWHWDDEQSCSYRVAHITRAQRALQNSSKTSLRIGNDGTMNMQFLVPSPVARGGVSEAFISFRVNRIYRSLTAIDLNGNF